MEQQILKKRDVAAEVSNNKFKLKVEELTKNPVYRKVKLAYVSSCGCGSYTTWVMRTVPYDSPLRDGDYIRRLENGDVEV